MQCWINGSVTGGIAEKIAFELDIQFPFKYQGNLLRLIHIAVCVTEHITEPKGGRKE